MPESKSKQKSNSFSLFNSPTRNITPNEVIILTLSDTFNLIPNREP